MPERMSVKGFLRAFRCVGLKGTNDNDKYFMMYDVKNKDILSSKQYLNRLNNPTDWTSKILSKYVYPSRAICEVIKTKSLTSGLSGFFVTIRYLAKNNEIKKFDIIVNATSLGLKNGDDFDFNFSSTKENVVYIDTIYNPLETRTCKFLKEEGRKVFNGLDMFIYQGQKSFYLWNNINPEIDDELIELLEKKIDV